MWIAEAANLYPTVNRVRTGLTLVVVCSALIACVGAGRSDAQRKDDQALESRVRLALNSDGTLYASHITVNAMRGEVDLGGYVWDREDLVAALRVAGKVQGVRRVVNNLELEDNGQDNNDIEK